MGVDITVHIELKYNDEWLHYSVLDLNRNYELFDAMAGIMSGRPIIAQPKGIPDDISTITRLHLENTEYTEVGASWFDEDEIDLLRQWTKVNLKVSLEHDIFNRLYLFDNGLTDHKHYMDDCQLPEGCESVRMVFWFDQ